MSRHRLPIRFVLATLLMSVPLTSVLLTSAMGVARAQPATTAPDSAAPDSAAPDSAAPDSAAPDSAAPTKKKADAAVLLETAKQLYAEAATARAGRDWPTCYAKLKAAWAIQQSPEMAAMLGDCAVGAGHYREGAEALARFFRDPARTVSHKLRALLQRRLEQAKAHTVSLKVTLLTLGANVSVNGRAVTSFPSTVYADPGKQRIDARLAGFDPFVMQLSLTAGQTRTVVIKLSPATSAAPGPDDGQNSMSIAWPLATGGVSLVALIAGAGVLVAAGNKADHAHELKQDLPPGACASNASGACNDLQSAVNDQQTFNALGTGLLIVGATATAVTVGLWVFGVYDDPAEPALQTKQPRQELTLRFSPTTITLMGTF